MVESSRNNANVKALRGLCEELEKKFTFLKFKTGQDLATLRALLDEGHARLKKEEKTFANQIKNAGKKKRRNNRHINRKKQP